MKKSAHRVLIVVVSACLSLGSTEIGWAHDVTTVLSSRLSPYVEALAGFQEAVGRPIDVLDLAGGGAPEIGEGTRVVVAFGGKAALQPFPRHVTVVYAMAPGTLLPPGVEERPPVKVHMLPRPGFVVSKLKEIHPSLTRLAIFWASDAMGTYVRELETVSGSFGVQILAEQVADPEDVPEGLRALLLRNAEGIWLPPDPLLVNARSFSVLGDFSWANDIPFFVPTSGLVEKGAAASIACSFREIGRRAAQVARQVLSGERVIGVVYPSVVETTINRSWAAEAGLQIPETAVSRADRVLP